MHTPALSKPFFERIPLERFLAMSTDDLRGVLYELKTSRARRESVLDDVAIESLIRVMDRGGHRSVSALGPEAAKAWAARAGVYNPAT